MIIRTRIAGFRSRTHWKNALFAMAAGVGMLTTTLLMATAPEHPAQEVVEKAWPVSTAAVEVARFTPEMQVFGRVESPRHTRLSSALDAPVRAVHVREGDHVRAGQPLVTLDSSELELLLAQRSAQLSAEQAALDALASDFASEKTVLAQMQALQELAQRRVTRLTELYARQLVSTTEVDTLKQEVALRRIELSRQEALVMRQPQRQASAEAAVKRARAAVDEQRLRIERSILRAPFDARVTQVDVSEGDRIQPGRVVVALYDTSSLRLRARLPSGLADTLKAHVAAGAGVAAAIDGVGELATLEALSSEIEAGSSGVDAFFDLPPDSHLDIGRTVKVTLHMPPVDGVAAVPPQSLHDNRFVYVVEDGRLQAIQVTTHGTRRNAMGALEVLVRAASLRSGAEILVSDMPEARHGLRVQAA